MAHVVHDFRGMGYVVLVWLSFVLNWIPKMVSSKYESWKLFPFLKCQRDIFLR